MPSDQNKKALLNKELEKTLARKRTVEAEWKLNNKNLKSKIQENPDSEGLQERYLEEKNNYNEEIQALRKELERITVEQLKN